MTEQEQQQTSIEYLLEILGNREDLHYGKFDEIFLIASTKYENEIKESFEKGYEEGVKYTDGLISDEKFPF